MFSGGNTPDGFVSFFGSILSEAETSGTVYLKGPSGSGKSTFIKKAGAHFEAAGYDTEYFHCSNDAESLDGLRVRGLEIGVVDGTAPHVCDPVLPCAADGIVNLGCCIDGGIGDFKNELLSLNGEKKRYYEKAYNYLKAAHDIRLNDRIIYGGSLNVRKLNRTTLEICKKLKWKEQSKQGRNRRLFASSITPGGLKNFLGTLFGAERVYVLKGEDGTGTETMLSDILRAANQRGFDTECFFCPGNPGKLEHLAIPRVDVCFTTENKYHTYKPKKSNMQEIDFGDFHDSGIINGNSGEILYNGGVFDELLKKAMGTMKLARAAHDGIEEIYSKYMDFGKLDAIYGETVARLEGAAYG